MKFLVLLGAVCVFIAVTDAFTPEQRKAFEDRLIAECSAKESISDEELALVKERKLPISRSGKCFHACIVETLGFVKDNKFQADVLAEMAKMMLNDDSKVSTAREMAQECVGLSNPDRCEFAFDLMKCGIASAEKRGLNFRDFM